MTLAALIRGKRAIESGESATAISAIPAIQHAEEPGSVAKIAAIAVATPAETESDALPEQAADARRQRVLAMLAANPALRLAVVCDAEGNPVPAAVAIRGKGTCEVLIPAARFDPFRLLDLVARHGGTVH